MDIYIRPFVERHAIDILILIIFATRVLIVSSGNLLVKLGGFVASFVVIYIGGLIGAQYIDPETPIYWSYILSIVTRLIVIKILFVAIDWDD